MRIVLALTLLTAALHTESPSLSADENGYARPELLIEPVQLADPGAARQFIILDARERTKYLNGHIPAARHVDHESWAKAFDHGQDAVGWSERIGSLGIGADSKVVVYDENLLRDAARIWWILRYWGVDDVRILNGGWVGWNGADRLTETTETKAEAVKFAATPRAKRLATKELLLKSLPSGAIQIVDARTEKEFCGIEKMKNKRAGAIPGAKHLEWVELIDNKAHRFKTAADLRKLFSDADIDLTRPTAAHCQTGGRSSVMAFAMELMGSNDVSNYYPSWSEWGNDDDTPIVAGKQKQSQ